MKKIKHLIFCAILLLSISIGADESEKQTWTIAPTQQHVIKSVSLDRNIRLQVGLPEKYDSEEESYGALYYLDGFAFSGTLTETIFFLRRVEEIPKLITVGIDLEVNNREEWYEHRSFILTPTKSDIYEKDFGVLESWTGGGPDFLKSLKEEIIPFVEAKFRTNPNNRALVGHSFGGLFALYTMFEDPELFGRYLISSPSLPWDSRVIFKNESKSAKKHSDLPVKVFLSVGSLEDLPDDMMVHHMLELASVLELRNYSGLDITSIVFEDEIHQSVFPSAFSRGLRILYSSDSDTSTVKRD